jgi:hypothetical protein
MGPGVPVKRTAWPSCVEDLSGAAGAARTAASTFDKHSPPKTAHRSWSSTPPESPWTVSSPHVTILQHREVSSYRSQSDSLVGLEKVPLSASVLHQRGANGEVRLRGIECAEKNGDFCRKAKELASRLVFERFHACRIEAGYCGPLRQARAVVLLHDEKSKPRPTP